MTIVKVRVKGGEGSGYFNHPGRPNKVGGSAPRGQNPTSISHVTPPVQAKYHSLEELGADYPELLAATRDFGESEDHQDLYLKKVLEAQGFDGPPDVVDDAELDQRVQAGDILLWRGIDADENSDKFAEQFRSGELYVGQGTLGNGTYASVEEAPDVAYDYSGLHGTAMKMALKRDSKHITYNDLYELRDKEATALRDPMHEAQSRGDTDAFNKLKNRLIGPEFMDMGRFAAIHGYDAILGEKLGKAIPGGTRTYVVILNRTAVSVSSHNYHRVRGDASRSME